MVALALSSRFRNDPRLNRTPAPGGLDSMELKVVTLKLSDGREVLIRRPSVADLDALMAFFTHLPADIKQFLRYNVHNHEILTARLGQIDGESHWRLIAEISGKIIADGTMDRDLYGWTRHLAELRVIVDDDFEALGVRAAVCEEFVVLAQAAGIERLQTEVPVVRTDLIPILEELGFQRELVRKNYARGVDGKMHDVAIMSNDLGRIWEHLEGIMHEQDAGFSGWFSGQH
jgi:hypothetical protein